MHRLSCELEGREKELPKFIEAREQGTAAAAAAANRERPEFLWNKVKVVRRSIVERHAWLATYTEENIEAFLKRAKGEWMVLDGEGRAVGVSLEKLKGLQEEVKEGMPRSDWVSFSKKKKKTEGSTKTPAEKMVSHEGKQQQQLTEEEEDDLLFKLADLKLSEGEAGEEEGEGKGEGGGGGGGGGKAEAAIYPVEMGSGAKWDKKQGVRRGNWTLL